MGSIIGQVLSISFLVGVMGNLVASAVLGVPALIHLHRKIDANHREHMRAFDRVRNHNAANLPDSTPSNPTNSPND